MTDILTSIQTHNAGRDAERLAMKYRKMRADPYVFLRGTCHLFYQHLAGLDVNINTPPTWVCGDLHLENFGSYKGDNRLTYFDINDFDEAALAPCGWDLVRFLSSIRLGADSLSINDAEADMLSRIFVDAYAAALAAGKARWVERETACGLVRDLLDGLGHRSRVAFLDSRTETKGRHRRIRRDGTKALHASEEQRAHIESFIRKFSTTQPNPKFFEVLDVARRIAGTGSLGVDRYIVLVEGKGSPDGNYLLDLKEALPSSLLPNLRIKQQQWASEADRVVALQERLQAIAMAFLHAVTIDDKPYILRGLQPSEDRIALNSWNGKIRRLEEVLGTMGQVLAWDHLRSSGRGGSAIADELVEFGKRTDWQKNLHEAGINCTAATRSDWKTYAEAFDDGYFN